MRVQPGDGGPVGDVQLDGMHVRQPVEVAEISGRPGSGVNVPASIAHVSGDGQTDPSTGTGH